MCAHNEIYLNGECKTCDREAQAKYRKRRVLAMSVLRAAESRGLTGNQAIELLQAVDGSTVQEYRRRR